MGSTTAPVALVRWDSTTIAASSPAFGDWGEIENFIRGQHHVQVSITTTIANLRKMPSCYRVRAPYLWGCAAKLQTFASEPLDSCSLNRVTRRA